MATICPYQNRKCDTCPHYRPDPDSIHGGLACWVAQDQLDTSKTSGPDERPDET